MSNMSNLTLFRNLAPIRVYEEGYGNCLELSYWSSLNESAQAGIWSGQCVVVTTGSGETERTQARVPVWLDGKPAWLMAIQSSCAQVLAQEVVRGRRETLKPMEHVT